VRLSSRPCLWLPPTSAFAGFRSPAEVIVGAVRGTAQVIVAGHAFMQNLRRGHYELGVDAPPALLVAAAFTELAQAI
jgi:hypothetical protein